MRLISLSKDGLQPVVAQRIFSKKFQHDFYAVSHGAMGDKSCWQIRMPIPREAIKPRYSHLSLEGVDLSLVNLQKLDTAGQASYMLCNGKHDDTWLVLFEASRLDAVSASGAVELLPASGHSYYDKYLIFMVTAVCRIRCVRKSLVKDGEPAIFGATFDGKVWKSNRKFIFEETEVVC